MKFFEVQLGGRRTLPAIRNLIEYGFGGKVIEKGNAVMMQVPEMMVASAQRVFQANNWPVQGPST